MRLLQRIVGGVSLVAHVDQAGGSRLWVGDIRDKDDATWETRRGSSVELE